MHSRALEFVCGDAKTQQRGYSINTPWIPLGFGEDLRSFMTKSNPTMNNDEIV